MKEVGGASARLEEKQQAGEERTKEGVAAAAGIGDDVGGRGGSGGGLGPDHCASAGLGGSSVDRGGGASPPQFLDSEGVS